MKRFILFFAFLLTCSICIMAQETAYPLNDTEVVRKLTYIDIEGVIYDNVVVTLKSKSPNYFSLKSDYKVKVTVRNSEGKKIWKKTLRNVNLYVFSTGQVQVGKYNFDKIVISRSSYSNDYFGMIREKEGIYSK